ncbi:MAG TPA: MotA/TolQ/ExbB proton channel family protein [Opitutaceae bacterium]|nr:MotA/TolQ/ExbB proton channel family protein [Opitutaceae bacterium]
MTRVSRLLGAGLAALCAAAAWAQPNQDFDAALKKAAADYATRLRAAGEELNRTRERIGREKAPLLDELRAAEDRLMALEREVTRMSTGQEQAGGDKRRLLRELDEVRKSNAYISTLAHDGLKALADGLPPGEASVAGGRIEELQQRLESAAAGAGSTAATDAAEFMLERTERLLGGSLVAGRAMNADDNRVLDGTFAFVGPEVFFRPADGSTAGPVRLREGMRQPAFHPLPQWPAADAAAFFAGQKGAMLADPTGGKALRLEQTSGSWLEHIEKGGKVAFAIVAVGFLALLLIIEKFIDVTRLRSDPPEKAVALLRAVAAGQREQAERGLAGLGRNTRELFAEGLKHLDETRTVLEERLQSVLLAQRLRLERRLPLLAVIATAAPLMGLLGTVVGMVKTFSLITVFGTGNAAKLSSGISEVLVATELGLAVAIPALVVHGFLAHRVHKHVAVQERHALEFATAAEIARAGTGRTAEEVGV